MRLTYKENDENYTKVKSGVSLFFCLITINFWFIWPSNIFVIFHILHLHFHDKIFAENLNFFLSIKFSVPMRRQNSLFFIRILPRFQRLWSTKRPESGANKNMRCGTPQNG